MREQRRILAAEVSRQLQDEMKSAQDEAYRLGQASMASHKSVLDTIAANVDNDKLSAEDFRQFVRNSLPTAQTGATQKEFTR